MTTLTYVLSWVMPSVLIGVMAGYYLGRGGQTRSRPRRGGLDEKTLSKVLSSLLESINKLTDHVDSHNAELENVGRTVGDWKLDGELEEMQHALLGQVSVLIHANKRLEDDLGCANYQMEEQAQELDRTRKEARTDTLSGVANRKGFDETLRFFLSSHHRDNEPFSVLLADIDHFKWINDTHGHNVGDQVVTNVASELRECVRSADHVSRIGGDEFAVLMPHVEIPTAEKVAERIRLAIERRNFDIGAGGERVAVTFSMGLAAVREGDTPKTLMERADQALYKSKRSGRNQWNSYEEEDEESESPEPSAAAG